LAGVVLIDVVRIGVVLIDVVRIDVVLLVVLRLARVAPIFLVVLRIGIFTTPNFLRSVLPIFSAVILISVLVVARTLLDLESSVPSQNA
jgi:hypothetical protein